MTDGTSAIGKMSQKVSALSQSANDRDILAELRVIHEREISKREALGDPLAAIYRLNLSLPWSLDACGPPITDIAVLTKFDASLVVAGRLANYVGGHSKLRWVRGRRAITEGFLETLQTSDGATWDRFAAAYRPVFEEVERVKAIPEEELPPSELPDLRGALLDPVSLSVGGDRSGRRAARQHWTTSFPELDRALRVARDVHEAACVAAWKEALVSGRILLAHRAKETWEMLPPHQFEAGPPFQCLTLSEIEQRLREEDARAERVEAEEGTTRREERSAFAIGGLENPRAKLRLNLPPIPFTPIAKALDVRVESLSCDDDYAAIFSNQLQTGSTAEPGPQKHPKRRRGRPPLEEDIPIIQDLANRVEVGEFKNAEDAVRHRINNREHWFDEHKERAPTQEYDRLYGKLLAELRRREEKKEK